MASNSRKLRLPPSDYVEDVELYRPGGFHPVHLGDTLSDGKYRIIHKLGFGGFSTVWLAREESQKRYVALKIITAETSSDCPELKILRHLKSSSDHPGRKYVASILDHFYFEGPNGVHICLVSKVCGPSIAEACRHLGQSRRFRGNLVHRLAGQAAQALEFLHSNGVVHGDYTSSNILIQIVDIDAWSEQEIIHELGQPNGYKVFTLSGQDIDPSAPAYLIEPVVMSSIDPQWLRDELIIVDFGQFFFYENPPADGVATPLSYIAPEALFDQQASFWSDIWALGCIIFEIRSGKPLFESFFGNPSEVVEQMVQTLGKLPEPWWNGWEERYDYFDDHGKSKKLRAQGDSLAVEYPLVKHIKDIGTKDGEDGDGKTLNGKEDGLMESKGTKISSDKVDLLDDLLTKFFKYTPNQRLTLKDIISHSWFYQLDWVFIQTPPINA